MAEAGDNRGGDRRGTDRRGVERRRTDRRAPPPPWRRPPAFAAYGAVAMGLVALMVRGCGDDDPAGPAAKAGPVAPAPAVVATAPPPAQTPPVVEAALTTADFERLTVEGPRAVGRVVRAQLFCDPPTRVALMVGVDTVEAAIAPLVDRATQRVPGAECKWGQQDDPRREDFLLLIPPELAAEFASQPVTLDGYIRRRRLLANVEWIGRSRALSLQTVGIFRGLAR
ncbi:MAG TPA: hypothetical protein VFS20_18870 [Longimicrobium sp.]|nr:hypothetical protein [Longimicrobium sp.]